MADQKNQPKSAAEQQNERVAALVAAEGERAQAEKKLEQARKDLKFHTNKVARLEAELTGLTAARDIAQATLTQPTAPAK